MLCKVLIGLHSTLEALAVDSLIRTLNIIYIKPGVDNMSRFIGFGGGVEKKMDELLKKLGRDHSNHAQA